MKIGILAGESSGDLIGSMLIKALLKLDPHLTVEGIGGPLMIEAGCKSLFDINRLSVMGFIEPLKRLPDLMRLSKDVCRHFIANRPDVFIGIDSPDFNFNVEKKLHAVGIPIIHYVSPSVWAWRQYRVRKIAKIVDLMLTLFPFEVDFYKAHHVPCRYVGHPLAERIPFQIETLAARRALGIEKDKTYVALLPGSRHQEIRYLAEPLLLAAKKIQQAMPDIRFLVSFVNPKHASAFAHVKQAVASDLPIHFFENRSHEILAASNVVLVKSGTATLETMLFKKPMVIVYRTSKFTYFLAKCLVHTPHIGLPNLLANERLVPELIQKAATPAAIADAALHYLKHPDQCRALQHQFEVLHQGLMVGVGAADAVREFVSTCSV